MHAVVRNNLAVAGSYWALGYAVAVFFKAFGVFPAPNWPSASIALAAALVGGPRLWPGIFAGSFLANYTLFDASAVIAGAISLSNTLAPAVGALLIRRLCHTAQPFFQFRDVVVFTLFGAGLHGFIAATGGIAAAFAGGVLPAEAVPSAWLRWCLADAGGTLFFGPALLLWWHDRTVRLSRAQALELGTISLTTLLLTAAIFFLLSAERHAVSGLPYLLAAPLLWVTVRFSPRAGTTLFSAVAIVATLGTVAGLGPFILMGAERPLVTLGLMVVSLSIGVLSIGSLTAERKAAMRELEATNRELEERVAARTAELVRANRAKDEFLTTISHEMRTPLTSLLGNVQLLLDEPLLPSQRQMAERMGNSGESLLSLINDLLDLSRIEAGRLELDWGAVSVRAVAEGTVRMLETTAAVKGLAVRCDIHDVPDWVWGDAQRLRQALMNLLGNAVKFTECGEIRLEITPLEAAADSIHLCFSVSDTGIGIAEQDLAKLFRPFSQVEASTSRRYGGSGLGLMISKRLVEAMGGQIGVDSIPGQGSRFWFVIPLRHTQVEVSPPPGLLRPRPLSILLVEDVMESARVLEALIRREGHAVTLAEDGRAALAAVARTPYDLVLMDLQMPGMDGFETTRRLRALQDPAKACIPVFALTANVMRHTVEACLEAGMQDVVAKPLRLEQLNAKLIARFGAEIAHEPPASSDEEAEAELDTETLDQYHALLGPAAWLKVTAVYRTNSLASLERIRQAARAGDLEKVSRVAHSLAGSSLTLGISEIGALTADIEQAALEGDAARVQTRCEALSRQLPTALQALGRWETTMA